MAHAMVHARVNVGHGRHEKVRYGGPLVRETRDDQDRKGRCPFLGIQPEHIETWHRHGVAQHHTFT